MMGDGDRTEEMKIVFAGLAERTRVSGVGSWLKAERRWGH